MAALRETGNAITEPLRRSIGLRDKDNPESEMLPVDFSDLPSPPDTERESRLVELIRSRYKRAADARALHDQDILESMAFDAGKQWVEYNPETGRLDSLITDPDDRYYYLTDNQIAPMIQSLVARATSSDPDVWAAPLTDGDQDRQASEESESILSHCGRTLGMRALVREWTHAALIGSTTFLELGWDKDADAETPGRIGPDGVPQGVKTARIGEVYADLRLALHVYPDPKAKEFHKSAWVVIADVLSLSDIVEEFGRRGKLVEPESFDAEHGGVEGRLAYINSDTGRGADTRKNSATVLRMWERPSAVYPNGRYAVSAGKILLRYQDWPYDKTDRYPLVPLAFQKRPGSLWGANAVSALIPLQRAINRILSGITERVINDKLAILVMDGTDLEPDEYTSARNYKKISYSAGTPPAFQQPPAPSGFNLEYVSFLKAEMEHIAGSHEVSSANAPPAAFAQGARALELRQEADNSRLGLFVSQLESALVEAAEWQLALYRQYGSAVPRLMGIDEDLMPGKSAGRMQSFRALGKGSCRVVVTPGSGMPKSPAARQEMLDEWFEKGIFGPPGTPAAAKTFLELQETVRSDELVEKVEERINAQAAQLMQMQQQAQQSQQQAQAAAAAQAAQVQAQSAMQTAQMQAQQRQAAMTAELQFKQQALSVQQQHDAEMAAVKDHAQLEAAQADANVQMHRMLVEKQVPSVSLAGKLGPQGVISAEQAAGLQPDTAADAAKVAMPPPPAQNAPAKPNSPVAQ